MTSTAPTPDTLIEQNDDEAVVEAMKRFPRPSTRARRIVFLEKALRALQAENEELQINNAAERDLRGMAVDRLDARVHTLQTKLDYALMTVDREKAICEKATEQLSHFKTACDTFEENWNDARSQLEQHQWRKVADGLPEHGTYAEIWGEAFSFGHEYLVDIPRQNFTHYRPTSPPEQEKQT